MSSPVETVTPLLAASVAQERMRKQRIRHLVVVNGKEVVGVLSQRDLGAKPAATVAEHMSRGVVVATTRTTVRQAAGLMRGHTIGCLPVVDERGHLAGIVTTTDLLTALAGGRERAVVRGKRWTLKHRGPRGRVAIT